MLSRRKARKRHGKFRRQKCKTWCRVYVIRETPSSPVRYVGQTRQLLSERMRWHFKDIWKRMNTNRPLTNFQKWLYDIDAMGISPHIEVIDENGIWDISEAVWIDRMRRRGEPLYNKASVIA